MAIHILTLVASNEEEGTTSDFIAGSVNTNPVVIRRISAMLKKAGILDAKAGRYGYFLTKKPEDLTLLDIYLAVQKQEDLFAIHDQPNPNCHVGSKIQDTLEDTFTQVQQAMENELAAQTLADMLKHLSP